MNVKTTSEYSIIRVPDMPNQTYKPRLIFFQWNHEESPKFLQLHMQLHVKCLSEFFDVILINKNCDYQQICDLYQPDLTLFESGYRTSLSKKLIIRNTNANPQIPKLGLHNGDPWCDCRIGFISDMEHWGIETFFSISTATAEHTPAIAENLFVWPNFIDGDIYRDYSSTKVIPVLFNGSMGSLYPWRQKIYKLISNRYPCLIFPHLGYESHSSIMIHGEQYARTINASWFVPSCGSVAKEIVRKHFEIPGCKSCLITERTPSLEIAGFVDMQNCIFADEENVVDKIEYLLKNTHELEKLINAAYELAHTRHTLKQRDQILQWFKHYKNLKPSQKIVQTNPFEAPYVVEKSKGIKNAIISCEGLNLILQRQGDEKLWSGKYDDAEALYLRCLNYIYYIHEPKLKLSICNLYKGNATEALRWITEPNLNNFSNNKGMEPDPIEWAYLIIALLCNGRMNEAIIRANQFPSLEHVELNRTRRIINYLQSGKENPFIGNNILKPRCSIHQLPQLSFDDWVNNLCIILSSCKQFNYAEILSGLVSQKKSSKKFHGRVLQSMRKEFLFFRIKWLEKLSFSFDALHIPNLKPGLPPIFETDYIIRLCRWIKIDVAIKTFLKYTSRLYHLRIFSSSVATKGDEFVQTLQKLLQKEDIKTILFIGSLASARVKYIFRERSAKHNKHRVFHINISSGKLEKSEYKRSDLKYYEFKYNSFQSFSISLNSCIAKVKKENEISCFDLVLLDNSVVQNIADINELKEANFIILENINTITNYKNKQKLIADRRYTLLSQDPSYDAGYAIFQKLNYNRLTTALGFEQ